MVYGDKSLGYSTRVLVGFCKQHGIAQFFNASEIHCKLSCVRCISNVKREAETHSGELDTSSQQFAFSECDSSVMRSVRHGARSVN